MMSRHWKVALGQRLYLHLVRRFPHVLDVCRDSTEISMVEHWIVIPQSRACVPGQSSDAPDLPVHHMICAVLAKVGVVLRHRVR